MASFTDQISKFNPYIQQLPVEAMAQVGMFKQQKYDEGVQKIQGYIDRVAGLEILRDVDKQYLQSKLDELGNRLKTVAAGDFSNFQLVNSVGGMATQIVKDPIVNAALKSTAQDKKNMEQIETDRKTGKLGPENEYNYSLQRRKYLNAGLTDDEGSPINFSGTYTPFRDVYGKLRGIAKDVGVDERLVQNLFNPDGSVSKVMIETLTKGKDVDKIYNAFVNGLDEGDYQQLRITGAYKYRNTSPDEILSTLKDSNDQYISTAQSKKADLMSKMAELDKKLISAKPEDAEIIRNQILEMKTTIKKIDDNILDSEERFEAASANITSGDEDFLNQMRGKIHTNTFLTNLSKDFAEKISHVKIMKNPLWEAIMDEQKLALEKSKAATDAWYKRQQINNERARIEIARKQAEKKDEEETPLLAKTVGELPGGKVDIPLLINTQYQEKMNERNQKLIQLARWDMKRIGWDDAKISSFIKGQARRFGMTEEQMLTTWGTNTYSEIKSGKITPPSEFESTVQSLGELNNTIGGLSVAIKSADERVKNESPSSAKSAQDILRNAKPVTFSSTDWATGTQSAPVTLSPSDQLDLAKYVAYSREIFSTRSEDQERKDAIARLENKFGKAMASRLLAYGEAEYAGMPSWGKRFLTGSPVKAAYDLITGKEPGQLTEFQKILDSYTSSAYRQHKDVEDKVYSEVFSGYYPSNKAVVLTSKSRPVFEANLAAMFIDRPEMAEIQQAINSPNSQIVVTTVPSATGVGGSYELSMRVVGKDGKTTAPIMMSDSQYRTLFKDDPGAVDPLVATTRAIVNGSPDRSSNSKGIGETTTAYFGNNAFIYLSPEYRSRVLGGDFVKATDGRDVYYPKVYYLAPNSTEPIPVDIGMGMSLEEAMSFPLMMNDGIIRNIVLNK